MSRHTYEASTACPSPSLASLGCQCLRQLCYMRYLRQCHDLQDVKPQEDFILVIDADMIMRQPFDPVALGAGPGWAISAFFTYMKGVNNELAQRHVPQVSICYSPSKLAMQRPSTLCRCTVTENERSLLLLAPGWNGTWCTPAVVLWLTCSFVEAFQRQDQVEPYFVWSLMSLYKGNL